MNGGDNINNKKTAVILSVMVMIFAACGRAAEPADVTTFHVISDGVSVEETVAKSDYADFYIPEGMVTAFGSKELSPELKKIYEQARYDLGHFKKSVILPIDTMSYTKILDIIRFEELSFFPLRERYIGDYDVASGAFNINFTYYSDNENAGETMTRMNLEIESAAEKIMAGLTPEMGDYDKLKYFHDYLITNCETDDAGSNDIFSSTIYGTLIKKKALCEGYAKTFSYLCNLAGIENCLVSGTVNLPHMWNMVKLGGFWYHVDVTYDVPDENITFEHPEFISYQYFLVSDEVMENDRTIDSVLYTPPYANAQRFNYFVTEGYMVNDISNIDSVITHAITNAINSGKTFAQVKFASPDLYLKAESIISEPGGFDKISSDVKTQTKVNAMYSISDYFSGYRIMTFFIHYSS
jgi:hypothetical protein